MENLTYENINKYFNIKKEAIHSEANIELKNEIIKVIRYFEAHNLNLNNLSYLRRGKFDDQGILYIDGDPVNSDLYQSICDIFILNSSIHKIVQLQLERLGYKYNSNFSNDENEFQVEVKNSSIENYDLMRIFRT